MKYKSLIAATFAALFLYVAVFAQSAPVDTPTPLPPPSTPKADIAVFTGTGEKTIDLRKFREPSLVRVWAYSHDPIFSVTDDRFNISLFFANTPYYGEFLLNYLIDNSSASLDVKSQGDWRIEILPLSYAHTIKSPSKFTGEGDKIMVVQGNSFDSLRIQVDSKNSTEVYGYGKKQTLLLATWTTADAIIKIDDPIQAITVKSKGKWALITGESASIDAVVSTKTNAVTIITPTIAAPTVTPPTSEESEINYEIVSIKDRITESNSVFDKRAWIMTVKNNGSQTLIFNATIQFEDKDGFIVDTDNEFNLIIGPNETKQFSGVKLINASIAGTIEKLSAHTKVVAAK